MGKEENYSDFEKNIILLAGPASFLLSSSVSFLSESARISFCCLQRITIT